MEQTNQDFCLESYLSNGVENIIKMAVQNHVHFPQIRIHHYGRYPYRKLLKFRFFTKLRESGAFFGHHAGGCVLFEKKELVETLSQAAHES